MPGKRMLRDMMSVNDIYSYAETIIELLREEYGSYDADTLDEVQVEERFAQRLEARGYEVRATDDPTPAPAAPAAAAPLGISQESPVVPVTVVRARRTTPSTSGGTTRTRRIAGTSDGPRSTGAETRRASGESARSTSESSTESGSTGDSASSETTGRAPRTRRTTRPRSSNNGEADT